VRTVDARPPAAWSVPARAAVAPVPLTASMTVPEAGVLLVAGGRVAILTQTEHDKPKPRITTEVTHLDLQKGTTVGETLVLRSDLVKPVPGSVRPQEPAPDTLVADLSPTGAIAVRDPADATRVDAWDAAGKWMIGLRPYEHQPLVAVGWSADGKLLTVGGGRMTAWELPSGKAVYELTCGSAGAALTPDHSLIAVGAEGHIDVFDTATGACRGRLDCPQQLLALGVSADGQHLAALFAAKRGAGLPIGAFTTHDGKSYQTVRVWGWRELRGWNLTDGRSEGAALLRPQNTGLQWVGSRHVLVGGVFVVDLAAGWAVSLLQPPAKSRHVIGSPDERVWYFAPEPERPPTKEAILKRMIAAGAGKSLKPTGPAKMVAVACPRFGGELAFGPRVPLRLEVDIADAARRAEATRVWTDCLHHVGQATGKGGWTLKITAAESETNSTIEFGPGQLFQVKIPIVTGRSELRAPDGTVVQVANLAQRFPGQLSKYFKKRTNIRSSAQGMSWTELYDFRGQDPRKAMSDETWQKFYIDGRFYGAGLVKADGKYAALPQQEVVTLP
jgi:hypothetical protein